MKTYKVGFIVGSLSKDSINRKLALAMLRLAPRELELTEIPIWHLSMYNRDYDADFPLAARTFKQAIESSDALLFVTPEYNRSIPGVLKNAIDWASRPAGRNSFASKPSGIIGTSPGALATAIAQQHLRTILNSCNSPQMISPEAFIRYTPQLMTDDGVVNDASTARFLRRFLAAFHAFIAGRDLVLPAPVESAIA